MPPPQQAPVIMVRVQSYAAVVTVEEDSRDRPDIIAPVSVHLSVMPSSPWQPLIAVLLALSKLPQQACHPPGAVAQQVCSCGSGSGALPCL